MLQKFRELFHWQDPELVEGDEAIPSRLKIDIRKKKGFLFFRGIASTGIIWHLASPLPSLAMTGIFLLFLFPIKIAADGKVTINEFVVHPSSGNKEWVEFYNPDNVDLTKYWLDDDTDFTSDSGSSAKKSLSNIVMGKDSMHPYVEVSSMFNNNGDHVVLFDQSGTLVDQYEYTKDPGIDTSIGRSPDGSGDFQVLITASLGDINSAPQPTATPTNPPSPLPTNTPKPTHTPVPTKTPTLAKTENSNTNTSISLSNVSSVKQTTTNETVQPSLDLSGVPTSILGISTAAASEKNNPQTKKTVLVRSATEQRFSLINLLPLIGALCFITCGILVYLKIRSRNNDA